MPAIRKHVMKTAILASLLCFSAICLKGQNCTGAGQAPSSAILLCGFETLVRDPVAGCNGRPVPTPCNGTYNASNGTWFKMNCFSSGSFGFIITPVNGDDNYDWQLFDVTGRNDDDALTDASLFVACNWSPELGETGASGDGLFQNVCADAGAERFSQMPELEQGHEYLLLVVQRNASTTGFLVLVTGGNASITDPVEPAVTSIQASCDGMRLNLLLNKRMICSSIAADGSEFRLDAGPAVLSAQIQGCDNDESDNVITIVLSSPIQPGDYTFFIGPGTDGNTVLDRCQRQLRAGTSVALNVSPPLPTPLSRIEPPGCGPSTLRLYFGRPIRCSSIAADGSDFVLTGPAGQSVRVTGIGGLCGVGNPPVTQVPYVDLQLSGEIIVPGNYSVTLASGSDGNTILDECGRWTPPGSTVSSPVAGAVDAEFLYTLDASCQENRFNFSHDGGNSVSTWDWRIDNNPFSSSSNPAVTLPPAGDYLVQLIVSNGFCNDTTSQRLTYDNKLEAKFEVPEFICPQETIGIVNTTEGNSNRWEWNFGNGIISTLEDPAIYQYPFMANESAYIIRLVAWSASLSCSDTAYKQVRVLNNCFIAVPSAFTPNGDGLNDFLHPANAIKAENLQFKVFNRMGVPVFESRDWTRKWDGTVNGKPQPMGVYAWFLSFTHRDTGKKVLMKGTTTLIR
ncbi:MAG: gliding motility-associated C-terminal domain-containing protein [Flavitalea sp.]